VHWPIRILQSGSVDGEETVTHDLSSEGFYFVAKSAAFLPGEIRSCILSMPSHDHRDDRLLPVECQARVIRVEARAETGSVGVGCRIEDYRFAWGRNGDSEAAAEPPDEREMSEELAASEGQTSSYRSVIFHAAGC
jgi:hypothetical protein